MTSTDNPASACAAEATQRICDEHIGRMLASETLREGSFDHDLLADLRDARAERDELRQRQRLLSDTFLAERDLDPKYFRRHRGRRVNPAYNNGYRMAMEDAARYARGDFTPTGKNLEQSIEAKLATLATEYWECRCGEQTATDADSIRSHVEGAHSPGATPAGE